MMNGLNLNTTTSNANSTSRIREWARVSKPEGLDSTKQTKEIPVNNEFLKARISGSSLKVDLPKSVDEYTDNFKGVIAHELDRLGITLGEDESLEIGIDENALIHITGLKDDSKARALEDELNTVRAVSTKDGSSKMVVKNMYATSFYINSDYAKSTTSFAESQSRANLIELKSTMNDFVKKMTGSDIDYSKMKLEDDGTITGYPKELAWIFEKNFNANPTTDAERESYATADSVLRLSKRLLKAGYDNIPDIKGLGTSFSFKNTDFLKKSIDIQV